MRRSCVGDGGARAGRKRRLRRIAGGAALLALAACTATKEAQLEKIAKDWNKVVRASQVIPIYPLSQDIQPGDVFLVQTPIDEQQQMWKEADYLPLDYHLTRIPPDGYGRFYANSFFTTDPPPVLPKDWLVEHAPSAAFPSYSFSVQRGGGLNLAVPVSGVPVGLSLLGADAAEGTLSLGSARTFGIDIASLHRQVEAWALEQRELLQAFEPAEGSAPRNFLRVVDRIYYVGSVDLSLRSNDQMGAGLDAGVPKPVELLTLDPSREPNAASAEDYANGLKALNDMLGGAPSPEAAAGGATALLPGGSLRVTAASARSIAMKETFDPPLVIGYLGFDVPILRGGFTGRPIPTHALLTGRAPGEAVGRVAGDGIGAVHEQTLGLSTYEILRSRKDDSTAQAIANELDALGSLVTTPADAYSIDRNGTLVVNSGAQPALRSYRDFRAFTGALQISTSALEEALDSLPRTMQRDGGASVAVEADSQSNRVLEQELARLKAERERLERAERQRVRSAVAYVDHLMNP